MSDKPGVMIYFDIMKTVQLLSDRQAGLLFRAILQYGLNRTVPELPESLRLIWPLFQMRLDTDDQRYHQVAQKRKYAIYVRWAKHHGQEPMPYDDWLCSVDRYEDDELPPLPI